VGTDHTDGLRLAYVPKYCEVSSETFQADDAEIYARFTAMVRKLVPDFSDDDVVDWTVQRAPLVEPVHERGHEPRTAPIWPGVDGLALASASQVYPRLLNGDSIVRLAEQVAGEASAKLGLPGEPSGAQPLAAAA
jgi:protoporphyrinogen oxidase